MNYTADEVAELLKERPNQAHYIAWLVQKAVTEAVLAEREACAKACEEVRDDCWSGSKEYETAVRCVEEIRSPFRGM